MKIQSQPLCSAKQIFGDQMIISNIDTCIFIMWTKKALQIPIFFCPRNEGRDILWDLGFTHHAHVHSTCHSTLSGIAGSRKTGSCFSAKESQSPIVVSPFSCFFNNTQGQTPLLPGPDQYVCLFRNGGRCSKGRIDPAGVQPGFKVWLCHSGSAWP